MRRNVEIDPFIEGTEEFCPKCHSLVSLFAAVSKCPACGRFVVSEKCRNDKYYYYVHKTIDLNKQYGCNNNG